MEPVGKDAKTNPSASANIFSRLFFCWLNPLFHTGYRRRLEEDDMYKLLPADGSKRLGEELQCYWDHEVEMATKELRTPKLTKAIIKCYWKSYTILGIFALIEEVIKLVQPVFLGKLIQYFEYYDPNNTDALYEAYGYAAGVSLSTLGLTMLHHLYFFHVQRAGMRFRIAMCHMIYKKALCLNNVAMGKTTTGQTVNLLSNDVLRFDEVTIFLHFLWVGPLQAAAVVGLLWQEIGPSCLAGMAVLVFLLPLQSLFGKLFSKLRNKTAVLTDNRIRTMNEVVSGIRIIKMYAWEKPFAALINDLRKKEISKIMSSSYLRGLNMAFFFAASKVIEFVTFTVYVLVGNTITASRVFMAVSLYTAIRLTVALFFPTAIEKVSEASISIRRIKKFLLLDELVKHKVASPQEEMEVSVEIQDLTCYWEKSLDVPTLQNISFSVKMGQLLTIIGPVGSGKSSLLSAILGELPQDKGVVKVKGNLAYASQQPWVYPGTIRSNILFGNELQPQRYEKVLKACALKKDMELLPEGDLTVIGDRGATLSGGQKARVNLARAVYQDADIYLLDDPLSAVDAEVGRHLFERCICGILKKKPRILVTHQLQYLKAADHILVLKEGHIVVQGTYTELLHSGVDFTSLLKKDEEEEKTGGTGTTESSCRRTLSQNSVRSETSSVVSNEADQLPVFVAEPVQTMPDESRSEGTIGVHMYLKYLTAGVSALMLLSLVLLNLLAQTSYILQDWWLAYWATEQEKLHMLNHNLTFINRTNISINQNVTQQLSIEYYLGIYSGLTVATLLFGFTRSLFMFNTLVCSAQMLHSRMFNCILRAPVHFFDINPIGRILNRFSKDIGHIDSMLPWTFVDFIQVFLQIIGVIAVATSVIPWILIPVLPLLIVFLFLRRYFLQTSRDIKRLEATTRSPVFSHLSSSLQGLSTIRACKAQERFQQTFDSHQDLHSEACFLFLATSRWFAVRLDGMCSVFVIITAFGCLLLKNSLEAGAVGLALSYAVTLMGMFQWGVRQSAEVENLMTSVERVVEYAELENEAAWETQKPPPEWPSQGLITFDQVNFSYSSNGPLVLKNLTAMFRPKEKVGIVGRTGAGKSSLISALFRLAEPQGKIYVDGVLISDIGLHDLRQKISIIPQDPVLFTGTLRKNLDPFKEHSDKDLWNALEEVQLKSLVEELPGKLETILAESGSNFSVGQRQLVCLARAILRKNRILIIDEATANVDPRTDDLIQKTIREKFQQCTVLTIAHRLNTIIDSDRILVLDGGRIHEYDEPHVLLQNKDGIFYKMVQQTGKAEAASLMQLAYMNCCQQKLDSGRTSSKESNLVIFETAL
ncbi:multidrug resistance-associated protein 4 isoform X2 [Neoarius graeffei]|uniref:multidrug resistance-associated protein 4 isoform X2 n=1 Tax=Neoarius graeffei TaxID=443677 RepID=UPI00298C6A54|nr:multidrug resistance-associated protein 4 isoform X2 [Neoarius graeffei]